MQKKGVVFVIVILCFPVLAKSQQGALNNKNQQNFTKPIKERLKNQDKVDAYNHMTSGMSLNSQATRIVTSSLTDNELFNTDLINSQQWLNQHNNILPSNAIINRWYLPESNSLVHIKKIKYQDTLASSAQYINGRFSAKTGFLSKNSTYSNNSIFYLQSALVVLDSDYFNLSVAARLDEQQVNYLNVNGSLFNKPIYTSTLGIIGTYSLNKNWLVSGGVTTTAVNEKFIHGQIADQNQYNQAIIGTTYSF